MSGWIVVDGHAVRTATLILSGMVGRGHQAAQQALLV